MANQGNEEILDGQGRNLAGDESHIHDEGASSRLPAATVRRCLG